MPDTGNLHLTRRRMHALRTPIKTADLKMAHSQAACDDGKGYIMHCRRFEAMDTSGSVESTEDSVQPCFDFPSCNEMVSLLNHGPCGDTTAEVFGPLGGWSSYQYPRSRNQKPTRDSLNECSRLRRSMHDSLHKAGRQVMSTWHSGHSLLPTCWGYWALRRVRNPVRDRRHTEIYPDFRNMTMMFLHDGFSALLPVSRQ